MRAGRGAPAPAAVLFLDEPTLGLDVTAQRRIRGFIAEYAARYGATVLLTSHYMADVEALAERVIVIHHGRCSSTAPWCAGRALPHKTVIVDLEHAGDGFERYGEVVAVDGCERPCGCRRRKRLRRHGAPAGGTAGRRSFRDPPIDEVIDTVFKRRRAGGRGPSRHRTRACTRTGTLPV